MIELPSNKLFKDLSPRQLERLREAGREIDFASHEVIFRKGDPGDGIYFIQSGAVLITTNVGVNDTRVLSKIGPGDMFGEMAVLDSDPRSANAVAGEPTRVWFIGRDELLELIDKVPRLAFAMVRDISKRMRAFNDQYVREVFEAERMQLVGRFASSIVHDLKNPLAIIGLSSEMACMKGSDDQSRRESQVRIQKQVERITSMVGELLDFAKGSASDSALDEMLYPWFVEPLIDDIQQEVAIRSVKIEYIDKTPRVNVAIDAQRLSRVFHNLIANATDAMTGGGVIKLHFRQTNSEVITELEDSGKGIAPQMLDRLFQAFATHGKSNGTGLGLSICKKIVEDHRGRIYARNVPGGGALFGFALPLSAGAPSAPDAAK